MAGAGIASGSVYLLIHSGSRTKRMPTTSEVKEQEYSLNPGRYVGVVIEEDGKTEEEFIEEIVAVNDELNRLNQNAKELEDVI